MRLVLKPSWAAGLCAMTPSVGLLGMLLWAQPWLPGWSPVLWGVLAVMAAYGLLDGLKAWPWSITALGWESQAGWWAERGGHRRVPVRLSSQGWIGRRWLLLGVRLRWGVTQPCLVLPSMVGDEALRSFKQRLLWDPQIWRH